jgi:hypothetical protein
MNNNEAYDYEGNKYINPTLSRDEQMQFIDNLRSIQANNNAGIQADTRNLGTDVVPTQGGLVGGEDYFMQRYQTPQVDSMVANLRATAQAKALSDVLAGLSAQYKQRLMRSRLSQERRANAKQDALQRQATSGNVMEKDPSIQSGKLEDNLNSAKDVPQGQTPYDNEDNYFYLNGLKLRKPNAGKHTEIIN